MTPASLITDEPWERVLFTSYALSLSFFESRLLKEGIVRNGCRFIDVLVDVDGYAMTLTERQSSRVGVDYRLVPLALANGVFHPKIALLSGKAGDLVLLGSGNLTLYGHGKNLEVVETLPVQRHPGIVSDLSTFLAELVARNDLLTAELRGLDFWREKFAAESKRQGPVSENRTVRIVHSVTRAVGDQMVDLAKAIGEVTEVRALSPFFDPNADGILTFAEKLEAPKLVIGLLRGRESATTFPFGATRQSGVEIATALIDAPDDTRRLHAKWIEVVFQSGERLVLTGSINATRKSLLTTDNIEAGVLRLQGALIPSPLTWHACPLPAAYQMLTFRGAGVGARLFVHAELHVDGVIRGRILGAQIAGASWAGELTSPDGRARNVTATLTSDGTFTADAAHIKDVLISTGLQLTLHEPATGRIAVGWVNQHAMLQAGRRGFLAPSTFLRFMSDSADASDDAALLRYIAAGMTQLLDAFTSPSSKPADNAAPLDKAPAPTSNPGSRRYGPDDLAPVPNVDNTLARFASDAADDARAIKYLMAKLRAKLLERSSREEAADAADDEERESDEDESDDTDTADEDTANEDVDILGDFHAQMRQLIDRTAASTTRGAIFTTWIEIALPHLSKKTNPPDAARLFARDWFERASSQQTAAGSPASLIEYVTATGLFIVACDKNSALVERDQASRTITFVHERLARFFERDITPDILSAAAISPQRWPVIFTRKAEIWPSATTPETALQTVMSIPTLSQQLSLIRIALTSGSNPPDDIPVARTKAGRTLVAEAKQRRRVPEVRRQSGDSPNCPHCRMKMSLSLQGDLRQEQFARCDFCSVFIMRSG